jgi:hypothetical protein
MPVSEAHCAEDLTPRREWAHLIGMLVGGARPGLTEINNALSRAGHPA